MIGSIIGASSAKKAGKAQEKAAEKGVEEERRQFDLSRLDFGPTRAYGSMAQRQMAAGELGLPDLGPISYDQATGAVGLWGPGTAPGGMSPLAAPGTAAPGAMPLSALGANAIPGTVGPDGVPYRIPPREGVAGYTLGIGAGEDRSDPRSGWTFQANGSAVGPDGMWYPAEQVNRIYSQMWNSGAQPAAPAAAAPTTPGVPPFGQAGQGSLKSGFRQSPGYQFQLTEGLRSLGRNAAAGGMYGSGARAKATMRYAGGLADQDYTDYYNRLAGVAGGGQTATSGLAQLGANTANNVANLYQQGGAARASGYVGQANAINQGIGNMMNLGMAAISPFGPFGSPTAAGGMRGPLSGLFG